MRVSGVVLGNAGALLVNLARDTTCRAAMVGAGGAEVLVAILQLQQRAAGAVGAAGAAAGGASPAAAMDEKILANAARALANLGLEPSLRADLVNRGVGAPLAELCRSSRAALVLVNAAWALANLAHDPDCAPQLGRDGAALALRAVQKAFGKKMPEAIVKPVAVAMANLEGQPLPDEPAPVPEKPPESKGFFASFF